MVLHNAAKHKIPSPSRQEVDPSPGEYIPNPAILIRLKEDRGKHKMSEHHDVAKAHEPYALHEEHSKGPHDPREINPPN